MRNYKKKSVKPPDSSLFISFIYHVFILFVCLQISHVCVCVCVYVCVCKCRHTAVLEPIFQFPLANFNLKNFKKKNYLI
jgi:hypothetical protein